MVFVTFCRTSVTACRGVKNVSSAKSSSCPSGNSETHTVPHKETHTYTRVHTSTQLKILSFMLSERHGHCQKPTRSKTHAQDRVCTRPDKDHLSHTHRKTHKICTFQNPPMETPTKGEKITCLRTRAHREINVRPPYRTCKHNRGEWHTLYNPHEITHTHSRGTLHPPGHYARIKHCRSSTQNTHMLRSTNTQ